MYIRTQTYIHIRTYICRSVDWETGKHVTSVVGKLAYVLGPGDVFGGPTQSGPAPEETCVTWPGAVICKVLSWCIYMCIYICMYMRVCVYACIAYPGVMSVCVCVCVFVHVYVCVYACVCVYIYIYIYIYIYQSVL
jgi:hypothetical protein